MATRLIIDGNAVYEIDEDCVESQKKKNGFGGWMKRQEYAGDAGEGGKSCKAPQTRGPQNKEAQNKEA